MNRKHFLSSVVPFFSLAPMVKGKIFLQTPCSTARIPPYLKRGDLVGITCPSGFITPEEVQPAVFKMKQWGFEVLEGKTVGERDFTFAGTDEKRRSDFQRMLDDPAVKAVMLGRGGYGAVRIIDEIDFTMLTRKPKWIIGFSDATVIHAHVNKNYRVATIHSKMCNSFPSDWSMAEQSQIDSIESIRKCLVGERMQYPVKTNANNKEGIGEGELVGGNLSILENLSGSPSEIDTDGKILFLEEVGEYPYNIDRMLWNLKRSGKFNKLSGLIIGAMKMKQDDPGEEFGRTIFEMVLEKVKELNFPVCFDFPVGHQKENYALKCGVTHKLLVNDRYVSLNEL